MKKSYLMIAAAATMLAACSSNEIKNDVKVFGDSRIAFSTYANMQTKADNSSTSAMWDLENHQTSFDVWSWKYYNGAWVSTAIYDKGTVNYSSGWQTTGANLKFWDKSADKYYFYAAAPSSNNWVLNNKYTASTNEFGNNAYLSYANFTLAGGATNNLSYNATATVTDYVPSFKDVADVDLMIAEDNEVLREKYNKSTPDDVNELFDHILSRLNVTVALKAGGSLATNNAEVKVTDFAITGVNLKNKGSFNENGAVATAPYTGTALSEGTTARWTALSTEGTYNLPGASISTTNLTTSALYIAQYLIIPQSITNEVLDRANGLRDSDDNGVGDAAASYPYFVISYTVNDEPFTAYYNLANAFGKTGTQTLAFNEGWQNTLNIKIDADIITFDPQVYQWTNANNVDVTIED